MTTSTNNTNSQLRYEPWLDARFAKDFALSKEQREAGRIRRENAELAPFRTFDVRNEDGVVLRTEDIGGALSFIDDLVAVEAEVDQSEDLIGWSRLINAAYKRIKTWLPANYVLFPVNPGRHRLVRTAHGMKCKIFLLFVPDTIMKKGLVETEAGMIGRMGPLAQHLKPGISFTLMTNATVVAGVDNDTNRYRLFDSLYFIKASSCGDLESNVIKIYGTENIAGLAAKMGAGEPDPIFKGVAIRVPEWHWQTVLEGAGLDPNSFLKADVIACNGRDVKFLGTRTMVKGVTFWQVMPTLDGKVARVTSEERQLDSLLPAFVERITARRVDAAGKISEAYEAYAAGDAGPLCKLVAGTIEEMAGLTEAELEQLSDEEREGINTLFNSAGRIRVALACGLPRFESEVINLIETLLIARIKGVNFKGVTRFSLPSMIVGEFGTCLNWNDMKAHDLHVRSLVTDIRYPNTGSGMLTLTVEFGHYLDGVIAHPVTGKKYQSEDYDGDMSVVVPFACVDNAKVRILASKNSDASVEGVTVGKVFATSSFGKLHIGVTDGAITRLIATGRTDLLPEVGTALQALIDMAKKNVLNVLNASKILKESEVPATPSSIKVLKGRIGTAALSRANISSKRAVCVSYPVMLVDAWTDSSCVDTLVRPWITKLPLVLSKSNSVYSEMGRHLHGRDLAKSALGKAFAAYEGLLSTVAPEFVFRYRELDSEGRKAFYEYRDFPQEVADRNADRIMRGMDKYMAEDPTAVRYAHQIVARYYEHTERLRAERPDAYEPINAIKNGIEKLTKAGKVESVGHAMTYLFLCIAGARSKKVMAKEAGIARDLGYAAITIKSTTILATLPVIVGNYSLAELVRKLGYKHQSVLKVLRYQDLAKA